MQRARDCSRGVAREHPVPVGEEVHHREQRDAGRLRTEIGQAGSGETGDVAQPGNVASDALADVGPVVDTTEPVLTTTAAALSNPTSDVSHPADTANVATDAPNAAPVVDTAEPVLSLSKPAPFAAVLTPSIKPIHPFWSW